MEARIMINKKPNLNFKPKLDLNVLLGGQFSNSEDQDRGISLTVHQPQLVRVVKLIEYIGFFSDFQSGAISLYEKRPLAKDLAEKYLNIYL